MFSYTEMKEAVLESVIIGIVLGILDPLTPFVTGHALTNMEFGALIYISLRVAPKIRCWVLGVKPLQALPGHRNPPPPPCTT